MRLKLIAFMLVSGLFGYSIYWLYISQNTDLFLEKAHEDLATHGVTFQYSSYEVSGFPYRLVLTFQNPEFSYQNGPLSFNFTARDMEAIAQPWNFNHFVIFPEESLISLGYAFKDPLEITLKPATIGFSVKTMGEGKYQLSAELGNVEATPNPTMGMPGRFSDLSFHLRKTPRESVETPELFEPRLLELALGGITLEQTSFQFNFSFRGQDVPDLTSAGLAEWRDQGGTLEADLLQVTENDTSLEGAGSLTLDNDLRPLGAISLNGQEWEGLLAFFLANKWVDENGAKLVRDFITTLPELGNQDQIPLALTLQDGSIYLGPARLGTLEPVIQE